VNVIIFGPPGAGKGTQAQNLVNKFNLYQVSTGDLLRSEIKRKTEIGNKIEQIILQGDLVSDDIVNNLLNKVITNYNCRNRIIFDGYPRNISQAKTLEIMLNSDNQSINFILFLKVSRETIKKRILGRIICDKCNKTMNEYLNKEEIDKHECGKNYLKKRKDDNQETIITRYEEYKMKTNPVLGFYSSRSNFHEIDGNQKIQAITEKIEQILKV
jgi:adenylate kinase|tara:strand:- start:527 stop:1168 length:642 start_codon:yes stop_codon:yes gene_type:complete